MGQTIMNKKDTIVTILCVAVVLLLLGAVGAGGREQSKRIVCMTNVRKLMTAWHNYADDNDDKLVNGQAGFNVDGEKNWIGKCWDQFQIPGGERMAPEAQASAIKDGALWPYVGELGLYACPNGEHNDKVTYIIMDGMNGRPRTGTSSNGQPRVGPDGSYLWVKKRTQITKPASRIAFIDLGWPVPDSFAVHWQTSTYRWWDNPPSRHNGGTVLSFADGHVVHHKWTGAETIRWGQEHANYYGGQVYPQTDAGMEDLHFIRNGCWGQTHPSFPWMPAAGEPEPYGG